MHLTTISKTIMVAAALSAVLLGSGCAGGPADITCEQFLTQSESEQKETVKAWREAKRITTIAAVEDMIIRQDRSAMASYCSKPSNASHKLTDLEYTWG